MDDGGEAGAASGIGHDEVLDLKRRRWERFRYRRDATFFLFRVETIAECGRPELSKETKGWGMDLTNRGVERKKTEQRHGNVGRGRMR